jgi:hypothetical protein
MAWVVTVMRFPQPLRSVQEAQGVTPVPLGSHDEVQAAVSSLFPGTDWSDPAWGIWNSDLGKIEFEVGNEDPCEGMRLHVRAQSIVADRVVELLRHNRWQGFDSPLGEFVDIRQDVRAGLEASADRRATAIAATWNPKDPAQFAAWRSELLRTGLGLVEGLEDGSLGQDRYVALVDTIDGSEGLDVLLALLDSMQVEDDHEVYECTTNAVWLFPPDEFSAGVVQALPRLLDCTEDLGGRILCGISNHEKYLLWFNRRLAAAPDSARARIMDFVLRNEDEGWFEEEAGCIRPNAAEAE